MKTKKQEESCSGMMDNQRVSAARGRGQGRTECLTLSLHPDGHSAVHEILPGILEHPAKENMDF